MRLQFGAQPVPFRPYSSLLLLTLSLGSECEPQAELTWTLDCRVLSFLSKSDHMGPTPAGERMQSSPTGSCMALQAWPCF
jgi:hypothetical protein